MIRFRAFLVLSVLFVCAGNAAAIDNLYVVQIGDGAGALTNAATPVTIKKFDASNGSPGTSISMPIAAGGGNNPFAVTGSSTSEGHMSLSTNGQYLMLGGYAATPATAAPAQVLATAINRVVARIPVATDVPDTSTALTDAYDGGTGAAAGFRSVASTNGTDIWMGGTRGFMIPGIDGVRYTTYQSTTSVSVTSDFNVAPSNSRVVNIQNGQLYVSSGSTAFLGVNAIGTGLPTTGPQTATRTVDTSVSGSGTVSSYDYWIKDANTVYVTDDRAGAALGGGIQKWIFNGTNFVIDYVLSTGAVGARGLDGRVVGADTILYATTAEANANRLVSIVDTGAASTATLLATAPTNTAFRGIVLVPGAAGVSGDYNGNGIVDGADYVLWRDGGTLQNDPNPGNPTAQYNFWRSRFGATSGSGSGLGGSAVPEPSSVILLLVGLAAIGSRRRAS